MSEPANFCPTCGLDAGALADEVARLNAKLDVLAAPKPEACGWHGDACLLDDCKGRTPATVECCEKCGTQGCGHTLVPAPVEAQAEETELKCRHGNDAGACSRCVDSIEGFAKGCIAMARAQTKAQAEHPHTKLLRMVAGCAPEFDDARVDYLTIQIDRDLWDDIRAALATKGGK